MVRMVSGGRNSIMVVYLDPLGLYSLTKTTDNLILIHTKQASAKPRDRTLIGPIEKPQEFYRNQYRALIVLLNPEEDRAQQRWRLCLDLLAFFGFDGCEGSGSARGGRTPPKKRLPG